MNAYNKYLEVKDSYKNKILLIKEGSFYKTYEDDAIILWYLFQYKWNNNEIAFSNSAKDKVIDKLKDIELSYVIDDEEYIGNSEVYDYYSKLSKIKYDKYIKIEEITIIVKDILNKDIKKYQELKEFLLRFK